MSAEPTSRKPSGAMPRRPLKALVAIALSAGFGCTLTPTANADDNGGSTTISFLSTAPNTTIQASQILLTPVNPAATTVTLEWSAQNVSAALAADVSYTSTVVTQTISSIWTASAFKTTNNQVPAYTATYSVNGSGTATGYFINTQDPTSTIKVTLTPKVRLDTIINNGNTRYTLTGSADLAFDFTTVKRSGDYKGTITCTITPTNF